jgi:peptide/nickel transport system substrate-binding protein
MKRNLSVIFSMVLMLSMVLTACGGAAAPLPQATEATGVQNTQAAQPTQVVDTPTNSGETPAVSPTAGTAPTQAAPQSNRKGGWLDKIIFSGIAEADPAVAQIEAGAVDMYAVSAEDAAVFDKVKADPNLGYANVYGSSNQLLFNTDTCTDTSILNPFTSTKIREAMNWAVDRNYIAQEIMGGLAKAKYTVLTGAFLDYSRYADVISPLEAKYAYNFDKAKEVVTSEMQSMGAKAGANGKWEYNGKPVTIIGIIRTEDKRKEIGNYFANQLEELGFTVDRQERDRKEAGPIWQGDPKACKFTFYTAGWINNLVSRDDGNNFLQYNTGEVQNIPVMNDYKPSKDLYDVSRQLFNNDFKTMDERRQLFAKALDLSMQESWWGVWVTDNIAFSPYKKNIQAAYDLAGGFASAQLWPYTMRLNGQEGGQVKIAQSGILVQPWNPIGGSNFTDDAMIQRGIMDWGLVIDPYTGLSVPKLINKVDVVAQEGLPIQKSSDWVSLSFQPEIKVPGDAWVDWDAKTQKFITAAEKFPKGITAKTKSTAYYIPDLYKTKWHDGSTFSIADVVMYMIMTFDPAKKDSKIYDESTAPALDTFLSQFKGVKIVSTDPLVIETYTDGYSLDAENTINGNFNLTWYPSYTYGPGAWHAIVPAMLGEENNEIAFTTDKATANKVEWTSMIAGPTLAIQAKYLDQAESEKLIPYAPTLSQYITPDEAAARYANLKKWYEAKKHFVIGTGPYYVDQVFPVEGTITLSHFDDYLFPASQWSTFGEPKIASASVEGPVQVTAGQEASFDVYVNFKDQPYASSDIEKVSYILYGANNQMVASGEAKAVADGQYQVVLPADVTSKLESGSNKLTVSVASKVVSLPAFSDYEFVVSK